MRLHRAIRLAQTSRPRFRTLRLVIRDCVVRFEDHGRIEVENGARWWIAQPGGGAVAAGELTDHSFAYWHFADMSWLTRRGVRVLGEARVAGRDGVELHVRRDAHSFDVLSGSDWYRYVVDTERGVLLRVESFFRGERIAVEEAVEVAFDEELPAELFEEPL